jgi:hypothetical protein
LKNFIELPNIDKYAIVNRQVYKQLENSSAVEEMNIIVERDIKEARIDNSNRNQS